MKGDFHVRFDGSGEGQFLPATLLSIELVSLTKVKLSSSSNSKVRILAEMCHPFSLKCATP